MHVETIVSDISVVFWGTRFSLLKYVVESVCATKARSQRMKWTELNSSSRTLIRKRKSTVSRRIGIHALRTDWAPTVLDSLEPINTKNTRDDDARDQWTLHVTGSTSSGQPRSVQFSSCTVMLWKQTFNVINTDVTQLTALESVSNWQFSSSLHYAWTKKESFRATRVDKAAA